MGNVKYNGFMKNFLLNQKRADSLYLQPSPESDFREIYPDRVSCIILGGGINRLGFVVQYKRPEDISRKKPQN